MEQVIYADVYFIVNLTMDALALWLTAKAVGQSPKLLRIIFSAAMGAIYSLLSLFLPDENPFSFFTAVTFPFLMILVAFGWKNTLRELLRPLAAFWVISFLLGGAVTATSYLLGRWADREALIGGQVEELPGELPYWGILLLALIVGVILSLLLRGRKKIPPTATLTIGENDPSAIMLTGMVDSGNLLTEPLSGAAVILVDREVATFLPSELTFLRTGEPPTLTPRLRLIPYSTPAGEGILYGYLPKVVKVNGKLRSACVAVAPLPKSEGDAVVILPVSLL